MGEEKKPMLCKHRSSKFLFKVVRKIDDTSVQIRVECVIVMYGALWNWNVSNLKINIRDESIVEFFIIIIIIFFIKNKYFVTRVIFLLSNSDFL